VVTAFVLSGGGSLGAVQVGMLQALLERGEFPDLLVGTSAGAINASYVAGHGVTPESLTELAGVWSGLRRRHVFRFNPRRQVGAAVGRQPSLFSSDGLRRLIGDNLPFRNLEDAAIPLHVVATDLLSGEEVLLSVGDAVSAVLASTAIPGLLPAVVREGRTLVDGGLANNAAISQAVTLGADRVFVLPAGVACALTRAPSSPFATAMQALSFLTQQRLLHDMEAFAEEAELHLLAPLCPLGIASADFTHGAELTRRALEASRLWLQTGQDRQPRSERFLSLHHHRTVPFQPQGAVQ
jgi:NTE family protein